MDKGAKDRSLAMRERSFAPVFRKTFAEKSYFLREID